MTRLPFTIPLLLLAGLTARAQGVDFLIEPYLTDLSTDRARINWYPRQPAAATFRYGRTLDFELGSIEVPSGQHGVSLTDLQPGALYHYRVDNSYQGRFRTQNGDGELTFAVLGHTHGTEGFFHYPDQLLAARAVELDPDFMLHTGDATYTSTPKSFAKHFFRLFRDYLAERPIYLAPGNHDVGWPFPYGHNGDFFRELFPHDYPFEGSDVLYYAFRRNQVLFLMLSYTSEIGPGSTQREWLKTRLEATDAQYRIVCFGGAQKGYYDRDSLFNFLAGLDIDLILWGDGFQEPNNFSTIGDIPAFFVGTRGRSPHGILNVHVDDARILLTQLDATGNMGEPYWLYNKTLYTSKVNLLDMEPAEVVERPSSRIIIYNLPDPVNSAEVGGLQMRLNYLGNGTLTTYAYVTPDDTTLGTRHYEGGLRTQHQMFTRKDGLVNLVFPRENPFTEAPYTINRIKLYFTRLTDPENLIIESMDLYEDPVD
ncbi:MAG: metallophosphoesterase [Acidobacteriota bacterium]|nr:metallophosphoesterase [Acidobacteriota bacterium]